MKVLIMKSLIPFVRNHLDILADTLCKHIVDAGYDAEVLRIPFNTKNANKHASQIILAKILEVWNADLLISMDYPTCLIRNKNHVVWLSDELPWNIQESNEENLMLSQLAVSLPQAKRVFVSSENLRNRLFNIAGIRPELMQSPEEPNQWHEFLESLLSFQGD